MTNKAEVLTVEHFNLDSIFKLHGFIEMYRDYAKQFNIEFTHELKESLHRRFKEGGDLKLIYAQLDGRLVGFAVYRVGHPPLSVNKSVELEDIMVDKSQRGKGIATALVKELVSYARSISVSSIRFITQKSNTAVKNLMLSNGAIYTDWEHGAILTLLGEQHD